MKIDNMKLNRKIWTLAVVVLFASALTNCSDWTQAEPEKIVTYDPTQPARPASYYEALRNYKKSKHSVSFGWFSGWNDAAASTTNMLAGVPDSMDIISLWNNAGNLSQSKIEDLRFVQEQKGTKVLICTFIQHIGKGCTPAEFDKDEATREKFWGWVDGDEAAIKASMAKYARAITDTILRYNYAGLDIDFEPNVDGVYGKLDENDTYVTWFLDELSQHLGPKSTSGKMLVVDGELTQLPAHSGVYFDYLISQAYSVSGGTPSPSAGTGESQMDSRLNSVIRAFNGVLTEEEVTTRFIVTENLESAINALDGGYFWTLRTGERLKKKDCPSLVGMARWQPLNGYLKGGFGGYQFGYEAVNKPSYKWMRTAIQSANPALN